MPLRAPGLVLFFRRQHQTRFLHRVVKAPHKISVFQPRLMWKFVRRFSCLVTRQVQAASQEIFAMDFWSTQSLGLILVFCDLRAVSSFSFTWSERQSLRLAFSWRRFLLCAPACATRHLVANGFLFVAGVSARSDFCLSLELLFGISFCLRFHEFTLCFLQSSLVSVGCCGQLLFFVLLCSICSKSSSGFCEVTGIIFKSSDQKT
jgi:hypothetical protein